jgi:hypothetical protein
VRDAAGDRYDDIELNMLIYVVAISDDRDETLASMAPFFQTTPEELAAYPHAWLGSVDEIAEDLIARRERWDVSYLVVQGVDTMRSAAPIVARLAGT